MCLLLLFERLGGRDVEASKGIKGSRAEAEGSSGVTIIMIIIIVIIVVTMHK